MTHTFTCGKQVDVKSLFANTEASYKPVKVNKVNGALVTKGVHKGDWTLCLLHIDCDPLTDKYNLVEVGILVLKTLY